MCEPITKTMTFYTSLGRLFLTTVPLCLTENSELSTPIAWQLHCLLIIFIYICKYIYSTATCCTLLQYVFILTVQ